MVFTKRPAAMMIGIRADESYNRFVAIASLNKQRFADDKPWTTAAPGVIVGTFTPSTTGKWLISGPGMLTINSSVTHCII